MKKRIILVSIFAILLVFVITSTFALNSTNVTTVQCNTFNDCYTGQLCAPSEICNCVKNTCYRGTNPVTPKAYPVDDRNTLYDDCKQDSDCKLIYSSCNCKGVSINTSATFFHDTSTNVCPVNACVQNNYTSICVDDKCIVSRCGAEKTLSAKIQCKLLERGIGNIDLIDETCSGMANPSVCSSIFAKAVTCYSKAGYKKDQCFKSAAGFTSANIWEQTSNKMVLREYIVYLLDDLQRKVELSYSQEKISLDQAAESIALIVKIKQDVLIGSTKLALEPQISQLKSKIRGLNI